MSLSAPESLCFLIDENVKIGLYRYLTKNSFNTKSVPKGESDVKVAEISKSEKRVLVTNDVDFLDPAMHPKGTFFAVVVLKIPQDNTETLLELFSLHVLGKSSSELQGKVFELSESGLTPK